ncbi:VOC family protein [Nonomuraea guangzhouensis]|uniref:VOC family protein n=1 Tax=Nonomuraea guangzhouensis TaxID=1291555 RepID=A0ABW4GU01_9ACTN|nr:VOC family protein [Nonomuraea guangzhouensis]
MTTTTMTISSVIFDCEDPATLADFYAKATGGRISHSDDDFATVEGGPVGLAFQRVPGYRSPGWPDDAKHVHLDLQVADVETAVKELVRLGAAVPEFQPGGADWTVLTDPEGHPFCVAAGG